MFWAFVSKWADSSSDTPPIQTGHLLTLSPSPGTYAPSPKAIVLLIPSVTSLARMRSSCVLLEFRARAEHAVAFVEEPRSRGLQVLIPGAGTVVGGRVANERGLQCLAEESLWRVGRHLR